MGNVSIVIGSWGSYNECNERALGSKWLDLSDYNDWEEIVEELKRESFELDPIFYLVALLFRCKSRLPRLHRFCVERQNKSNARQEQWMLPLCAFSTKKYL